MVYALFVIGVLLLVAGLLVEIGAQMLRRRT